MQDAVLIPLEGLLIYQNKMFTDERGSLFQLAPNIDTNPHFSEGIKNLIAVKITDKKPRGGHYHLKGADDVWTLAGAALWHFVDFRSQVLPRPTYSCLVGSEVVKSEILAELPRFLVATGQQVHAHIHCPPGIYHTVWSVGENPLIFVESKTTEFKEEYYIRLPFIEVPEVVDFKNKYHLE